MSLKKFYKLNKRILLGAASLIAVGILWELAGQLGFFNPLFFSWPSQILKAFYEIVVSGELFRNLSVSIYELASGFGIACWAIPIGISMGRSKTLEYVLDPIFSALYAMPRIALMPLIVLFFGIGINSKIVLVFIGCFFPILINTFQGSKNVDPLMIDMARVYGAKGFLMGHKVVMPAIMPYLLAGLRIALSVGLIMVVVGEFFVGNYGIGYMIATEAGYFHADAVMAWVMLISLLAIFLTEVIKFFEKRMKYWR